MGQKKGNRSLLIYKVSSFKNVNKRINRGNNHFKGFIIMKEL